jgi:hypothetical protein
MRHFQQDVPVNGLRLIQGRRNETRTAFVPIQSPCPTPESRKMGWVEFHRNLSVLQQARTSDGPGALGQGMDGAAIVQ